MSDSGKLVLLEQTPLKNFKMLATSSTRLTTYSPIHNKQTYTIRVSARKVKYNQFKVCPNICQYFWKYSLNPDTRTTGSAELHLI